MMLARLHTGNWNILALQNAYHGASPYARQLTSHVRLLNVLYNAILADFTENFGNNQQKSAKKLQKPNFNLPKSTSGSRLWGLGQVRGQN